MLASIPAHFIIAKSEASFVNTQVLTDTTQPGAHQTEKRPCWNSQAALQYRTFPQTHLRGNRLFFTARCFWYGEKWSNDRFKKPSVWEMAQKLKRAALWVSGRKTTPVVSALKENLLKMSLFQICAFYLTAQFCQGRNFVLFLLWMLRWRVSALKHKSDDNPTKWPLSLIRGNRPEPRLTKKGTTYDRLCSFHAMTEGSLFYAEILRCYHFRKIMNLFFISMFVAR